MTDDEKEYIRKVNIDKAKNKSITGIFLMCISLITYVVPLFFGEFDFGLVFEALTLVFIFIARNYMIKYDEYRAKRYTIVAMIPIGWLLIYDLITVLTYVSNALDFTFLSADFVLQEIFTILVLMVLFAINTDLRKADNPEKYKESTDWFYERLNENEIQEIKENENNNDDE